MTIPVNPNIIRLSKTRDWASKYVENKPSELAHSISKDLEIKEFIVLFFKKHYLNVHTCKLNYFNNSLIIFISYLPEEASLNAVKKINSVQKIVLKKKRSRKNSFRFFNKNNKKFSWNKNNKNSYFARRSRKKFKIKLPGAKKRRKAAKRKLVRNAKRFKILNRSTKNFYNYSVLSYRKSCSGKGVNKNSLLIVSTRIFTLQLYKKYLSLKKNKNITAIKNENIFNNLLNSLNLFLRNTYYIKLILKPLINKVKKTITKEQRRLLKSRLISFRYYQKHGFFRDGINLIHVLINQKNSSTFLSKYIAYYLKKFKRHSLFLRFVQSVLRLFMDYKFSPLIKSIQIKIKGRINAAFRTKRRKIILGTEMPILSFNSKINFNEAISCARNGTMSVKVWVLEKT